MDIKLTLHAKNRIIERTGLNIDEFITIYKDSKYLLIGNEKNVSKVHEIFYSKAKQQCFVSIRDNKNNEIITILPIDYHNNIAWEVSFEIQTIAKNIFFQERLKSEIIIEQNHKLNPSKFVINALCPTKIIRKKIFTCNAKDYSFDIDLLIKSKDFNDILKKKFTEIDKNIYEEVEILFGTKRHDVKIYPSSFLLNL